MALAVRRYRVEGEVQGVGFRWYVREHARALGLAGWVRNEPDGAVVLVAHGEEASLDTLERGLKIGPRNSTVSDVVRRELTSFDAVGLPTPFAIER
ncbi:acylphosphatase [Gemmatimonas groenlandica]|uniref:Acylphosphatase n=1 Tax=Gemmatimonas groenlandica TaxID=2732249 RepID=A0A6M4IS43_9BACT|nr:acylphosphatase [Gemmatimonas groenlandica]QJR35091.1 acylphosphatase [Gemmatimonas groenlandica]